MTREEPDIQVTLPTVLVHFADERKVRLEPGRAGWVLIACPYCGEEYPWLLRDIGRDPRQCGKFDCIQAKERLGGRLG